MGGGGGDGTAGAGGNELAAAPDVEVRASAGKYVLGQRDIVEGMEELRQFRAWHNKAILFPMIDIKWRRDNPKYTANPAHVCRRGCRMHNIEVTVARFDDDGHDDFLNTMSRQEVVNTERIHVCFGPKCIHARCGRRKVGAGKHYEWVCVAPTDTEVGKGVCPHSLSITNDRRRRVTSAWACGATGTVHFCGRDCSAERQRRPPSNELFCVLTHTIVGNAIDEPGAEGFDMKAAPVVFTPMLEAIAAPPPPPPRIPLADPLVVWRFVKALTAAVLVSRERQIAEAAHIAAQGAASDSAIQRGAQRAAATLSRLGAVPGATIIDMSAAYGVRRPVSTYFNIMGMRPDAISDIKKVVDGSFPWRGGAVKSGRAPRPAPRRLSRGRPVRCENACGRCAECRLRIKVYSLVAETARPTHNDPADDWDIASVAARRDYIVTTASRIVFRVYTIVAQFMHDSGADVPHMHERLCPAILMMLSREITIPGSAFPGGDESSPPVVVIPHFLDADLLPGADVVPRLPLKAGIVTILRQRIPMAKTITEALLALARTSHPGAISTTAESAPDPDAHF